MANITSFSVQSPYDRQMEELKRRQRMAELMQQEAMQPLESQVAPGGMVVPTSPVLGLAKLLQGYMSGKQLRDIEKQRGEAEQRAGTEAMDFLRTIRQGEPSKDAALAASLSPTPTESIRVPLSPTERQTRIESAFLGGSPQMKLAAQLASMKPERTLQMGNIDPAKFTPESVAAAFKADDPSLLVPVAPKPEKTPSAIDEYNFAVGQGFKGSFMDYKRDLAAQTRAPAAPEPLEAIVGQDGKPVYVNRAQAVGKTPFYSSSVEKPKSVPPSEIGKMEQNFVSIKKLDQTLNQLEKNPDSIGLKFGASQKLNDRLDPKGIDLRAGIADIGSLVLHDRSGAAITASESPRLMPFIPTVTDTAEAAKKKLQRFKQEYMNVLNEQNLDYSPDYGWSRPSILDRYSEYTRGSRKTINGVTYENRGKGPNDWHKVEEQ